ncbi:hypothetical protein LSAT2_006273 [Lamellibrachia satsuma]|nr:hypothetical protein LSAT2_006273 [Lamellibrachia satsuma]
MFHFDATKKRRIDDTYFCLFHKVDMKTMHNFTRRHLTQGNSVQTLQMSEEGLRVKQYQENKTEQVSQEGLRVKQYQENKTEQILTDEVVDLCRYTAKGHKMKGLLQQLRSHAGVNMKYLKLDDNNFSSQSVCKDLGEIVKSMTSLKSLSLCHCKLTAYGMKCLAEGLSNCQTLEKLLLSRNDFSSADAATAIKDILTSSTALKTLSLKSCQLQGPGAMDVASSLAKCTNMETLELSVNDFQAIIKTLVESIRLMKVLRSLGLDQCKLTIDGLKNLRSCENITTLVLSNNDFSSPAAGAALGDIFTSMSKLECLNMSCCRLSDDGMQTVTRNLSKCTKLRRLLLAENDFSNQDTCMPLVETLEVLGNLKLLTSLCLKCCKLAGPGAMSVAKSLERSYSQMMLLELSHNDMSELSTAEALGDSFKVMKNLQNLGLKGCKLSGAGACSVAVGLSECSEIKILDLSENDFSEADAFKALLESVKKMKSLKTLSLKKCQLSSNDKELLKGCVTCKVYFD